MGWKDEIRAEICNIICGHSSKECNEITSSCTWRSPLEQLLKREIEKFVNRIRVDIGRTDINPCQTIADILSELNPEA